MNPHVTLEYMHDLVDGLVPPAEEAALRSHLSACSTCRDEFASLEAAVKALRDLPGSAQAPDGLWSGIESRIDAVYDAASPGPKVLPLSGARGPRRFSMTLPQLAAAAVVVSLVSAATVWTALSRGTGQSRVEIFSAGSGVLGPSARVVRMGDTGYAETVARLQAMIDQGRDVLSPETLATLETSLRTIDEAIDEVRQALEADPSSELLARLLTNHQQSKLRMLRQAAISVQPRT
ncbi:MAG TPA: zf-HC2 domain-containing protein [Longimicrobiales bacterium]|nr:zf-HC2 domain-containing protein [Longimicrobiales bacterium]